MRINKFFFDILIYFIVKNASHIKIFHSGKLMARIQLSIRRNGKIFAARPTASQPLIKARPAVEVDHKMEEVESVPRLITFDVFTCKYFIFML